MNRFFVLVAILWMGISNMMAQEVIEWRGPNRTGIFNETGLLKQWPENGPTLMWSNEELPMGWSSMTIAHGNIYLTGREDTVDVVVAVSLEGKTLWETPYGASWDQSFQESRCTPTLDGDRLYVSSGMGDVACLNALNGEIIWKLKAHQKFNGTYGSWGIAESLIVLDNKVFFTPGGETTTMVALNKMTGETIWMSESLKDNPAYVSPLLIEQKGGKLIVNVSEGYIFAVNPQDGTMPWKFNFETYKDKEVQGNIHCNTPLYYNGEIFVSSGYNHAAVMLKLADDAQSVTLKYVDTVLDVHHGGLVRVGESIYGSNWENNRMGRWVCLDWNTGKVKFEHEWGNKGPIIAADDMLYCYEEKKGTVALLKPDSEKFEMVSSFKIPLGTGFYWAHPIIYNKALYIRHGEALMAYDIAAK